jgi:phage gp36-like protein
MSYATQADLEKLIAPATLVQLADDDHDGVADAGVIAEALEAADDQVNAYVGARYQVPFATTPGVINKVAVDLALYHLYTRRASEAVPEVRQTRYDAALKFLREVLEGKVSLGVQPAPPEDAASQDEISTSSDPSDRAFTTGKQSDGSVGSLDGF